MTLAELRDRPRVTPAYLVEISPVGGGPVLYFADKNLTVGGQPYEDFLSGIEWGGAVITLVFKNDRHMGHSHLVGLGDDHPFEGAGCVIKEVCLGDDGSPSDAETVFAGLLGAPAEIDLAGFKCGLSGLEYSADRGW